ncbi:wd40 repeat [Echinococcus multilocularis]|uniref:Wd40 repeat n=1 Tax=Echinococcus multilocularis TaxID=6211 RepID=A0A087VZ43_ECHMU|nr:wd40 repeat [Echinococcus multilocularis]
MTDEGVIDIHWDLTVRNREASLQVLFPRNFVFLCNDRRKSEWPDKIDDCTFSDALSILRKIELNADKEFLIRKYACELLSQSATPPECQYIKVKDLVQKAVSTYTDLLGGALVVADDTKMTTRIKGHSLFSIIRYTPSRLKDEYFLQFVFYQIICLLEYFHRQGIPYLNLETNNVFVDELLQVGIAPPCLQSLDKCAKIETDQTASQDVTSHIQYSDEFHDVLSGWILRKVSNYDYLMYINRLAGRRAGDATASAVLPWVTDFSSQDGTQHLRDLTRTKFRLTKGEHQLDATYLHLDQSDPSALAREGGKVEPFLPHHLLDMMPNLAYYTYKARQTSVENLQRYVRPVYRPEEFPSSLQRLYATTPEECIPEFFTDPTIFTSIHPDMPDLQLPEWFSGSTSDFLNYHRSVLESDAVSANLHHWIDLTFGFKLLGEAAVSAKNVHLELVSPNPPSNSRVTCLFSLPHPRRAGPGDDLIEVYEEMSDFFVKICSCQPPEIAKLQQKQSRQSSVDALLKMDLEDLACLITEVAVGSTIPGVIPQLEGVKRSTRLQRARHLFTTYKSTIPSGFSKPVELVLFDATWGHLPLGLIRRCVFDVPPHIVDIYRVHIGLHARVTARLEQMHLKDGPAPGALLNVFLATGTPPQRFDCPAGLLNLLTPMLERGIEETLACVANALVSGRLVQFYLAIGGKMAVEKYLLPLVQRLLALNSRLCSRRFIRNLFLSTRLLPFLSTVPTLLANSLLSSTPQPSSLPPATVNSEPSTTTITTVVDDAFCRAFLLTPDTREDVSGSGSVPMAAAIQDSLHWLATSLGPLATAAHLVPPLLAALTCCYWGEENLTPIVVEGRATRLNYCIPKSPLPMPVYTSGRVLRGDTQAPGVLRCLERLACLYGVEVITGLYLPAVKASVAAGVSTLRNGGDNSSGSSAASVPLWDVDCEARLISSLVFLHQFATYLPAPQLMDHLQEPIISVCLTGALTLVGRLDASFPSGSRGRLALLCKSLDCIYVLGVRLGFEMVRRQMTELIQLLFSLFDRSFGVVEKSGCADIGRGGDAKAVEFFAICESDEETQESDSQQQQQQVAPLFVVKLDRHTSSLTVAKEEQREDPSLPSDSPLEPALSPLSPITAAADAAPVSIGYPASQPTSSQRRPAVLTELRATFTPEMAYIAYIPLCRLAGGSHIESSLYNIDLIHSLVRQYEAFLNGGDNDTVDSTGRSKVAINTEYEAKLAASSSVSKSAATHLHGEWVEYFRVKVESSPSLPMSSSLCGHQRPLKLLGKHLVSFSGHSGAVRSITPLANESSFITTSNDRSVHLYSLTSARKSTACAGSGWPVRTVRACHTSRRSTSESGGILDRLTVLQPPPTTVAAPPTQPAPVIPSLAFTGHRRAVFASAYLHFERLVASLDASLLLLWDPVTGKKVSAFAPSDSWSEGGGYSAWGCVLRGSSALPASLSALSSMPSFRSTLLAGDEGGCLILIDPRASGGVSVVLRLSAAVAVTDAAATANSTGAAAENSPSPPLGISEAPLIHCDLDNLRDRCVLNAPGALRCVASRPEENNSVLCGFASGFVSHVDIRTGGVVATWRAHSDAVSQIFCHSSGWCSTTSSDRTIAFWRLEEGSTSLTCHRVAQRFTSMGGIGGGGGGIVSCASQLLSDSLLIAGPPASSSIASDSSPILLPPTCFFGCCDNVPLAAMMTAQGDTIFRPMGSVLLRAGQLSSMVALPLADAVLTGTTSGLLNLFY